MNALSFIVNRGFLPVLFWMAAVLSLQAQEDLEYRVVNSMAEWIEEINQWPDSVYFARNLEVRFNPDTDRPFVTGKGQILGQKPESDAILTVINKPVILWGVRFPSFGISDDVILKNLHFTGDFKLFQLENLRFAFHNVTFSKLCQVRLIETKFYLGFFYCNFERFFNLNNPQLNCRLVFKGNAFQRSVNISSHDASPSIHMDSCSIAGYFRLGRDSHVSTLSLTNTSAQEVIINRGSISNSFEMFNVSLDRLHLDGSVLPTANSYVPFEQISGKLGVCTDQIGSRDMDCYQVNSDGDLEQRENFDRLIASYTKLIEIYRARGEKDSYNACYVEMKELETKKLRHEYRANRSFDSFFTLKINQFLKVFSDYGTRPSKAIIFSVYVILLFAAVYLFFPNSWDSQGRHRIMNRYRFFMKYLNRREGMHAIYLEDKSERMRSYDEFKAFIEDSANSVPWFFRATALPLYRWSVAGTRLTASVLNRVDITKGKWNEVPGPQRWWKSILLTGGFLLALAYDLCIKMLNALMLSTNTFTTLGFGEIPIRGIARYLAIIEGFIGWFMLTIFSVSLISQLLN